jgi:hypothetical protein
MFRGNIDHASRTHIAGWVYCERQSLVGARVHAFVDEQCVGSGVVELFRQDLVEAGVGDGRGGFNFAIALGDSQDPRLLHIRVESGNAIIRQPFARLAPADAGEARHSGPASNPQSLAWMLERDWLTGEQHRLLHGLSEFGVCVQALPESTADTADQAEIRRHLQQHGAALFGLLTFTAVSAEVRSNIVASDLVPQHRLLCAAFPSTPPVIALWSPLPSCVNLVEGSHRNRAPAAELKGAGIDYEFGRQQLLWFDLDCAFRFPTGAVSSGLTAVIPAQASRGVAVA